MLLAVFGHLNVLLVTTTEHQPQLKQVLFKYTAKIHTKKKKLVLLHKSE